MKVDILQTLSAFADDRAESHERESQETEDFALREPRRKTRGEQESRPVGMRT